MFTAGMEESRKRTSSLRKLDKYSVRDLVGGLVTSGDRESLSNQRGLGTPLGVARCFVDKVIN